MTNKTLPIKKPIYPEYIPNPNIPTAIIVDIDGTLGDMNNRNPFDEDSVYNDDVRKHIVVTVLALKKYIDIIIITGRSYKAYNATVKWLEDKCELYKGEYTLYMRNIDDDRLDYIMKEDIYNTKIKDKYNIMVVFEDRFSVVKMWNSLNIPVFDCGEGVSDF